MEASMAQFEEADIQRILDHEPIPLGWLRAILFFLTPFAFGYAAMLIMTKALPTESAIAGIILGSMPAVTTLVVFGLWYRLCDGSPIVWWRRYWTNNVRSTAVSFWYRPSANRYWLNTAPARCSSFRDEQRSTIFHDGDLIVINVQLGGWRRMTLPPVMSQNRNDLNGWRTHHIRCFPRSCSAYVELRHLRPLHASTDAVVLDVCDALRSFQARPAAGISGLMRELDSELAERKNDILTGAAHTERLFFERGGLLLRIDELEARVSAETQALRQLETVLFTTEENHGRTLAGIRESIRMLNASSRFIKSLEALRIRVHLYELLLQYTREENPDHAADELCYHKAKGELDSREASRALRAQRNQTKSAALGAENSA
jgi:hypothetical protein